MRALALARLLRTAVSNAGSEASSRLLVRARLGDRASRAAWLTRREAAQGGALRRFARARDAPNVVVPLAIGRARALRASFPRS